MWVTEAAAAGPCRCGHYGSLKPRDVLPSVTNRTAAAPRRFALLLAGLLLGAGLAAQAPEEEPQPGPFAETVEVSVVNVDVYVTDRQGRPVTGLQREDFELFEDGRPVAVTNFYPVEGGRATAPEAISVAPPETVPAAPLPSASPTLPEEQRLHLAVYIDNFYIRPFNRNRVFRRLREFLSGQLGPGDRVMLVSYERSLHVRRPFTSDATLVAAALGELETMTGQGVHADSSRREMLEAIEEATDPQQVSGRLRTYAESEYNDLVFAVNALKDFVGWLAGLPGRKALLYVSDGVPMTPGEDLYHALNQKFTNYSVLSQVTEFNAARRFDELAALANASRVTFYALDASGLRTFTAASAESAAAGTPGLGSFADSIYFANHQNTLRLLADRTGGIAVVNTNDVGSGLERIAQDFGTYYSLGYSPSHAGDGRYHKIEVKVRRKGTTVRHRDGYRDKSSASRMADGTLSSLVFGYQSNPLQLGLEVGGMTSQKDGLFVVPVVVQIPIRRLVLVPHGEFQEARLRLFVSAMDGEGDMAPVQETPVPIRIPKDRLAEALEGNWAYEVKLLMRGGDHQLAVGVRDDLGAVSSFVRKSIRVGA